jgi:hypothetical protein
VHELLTRREAELALKDAGHGKLLKSPKEKEKVAGSKKPASSPSQREAEIQNKADDLVRERFYALVRAGAAKLKDATKVGRFMTAITIRNADPHGLSEVGARATGKTVSPAAVVPALLKSLDRLDVHDLWALTIEVLCSPEDTSEGLIDALKDKNGVLAAVAAFFNIDAKTLHAKAIAEVRSAAEVPYGKGAAKPTKKPAAKKGAAPKAAGTKAPAAKGPLTVATMTEHLIAVLKGGRTHRTAVDDLIAERIGATVLPASAYKLLKAAIDGAIKAGRVREEKVDGEVDLATRALPSIQETAS